MNQQQTQLNVLLLGDICSDEYIIGEVTRISPEAPIPILDYIKTNRSSGMAGNVYNNLKNFGCNVTFHSGDAGVKQRFIDVKTNQQLLRLDRPSLRLQRYSKVPLDGYDLIVISDYNKGFLSYMDIQNIVKEAKCPVFIDTKKTDIDRFEGAHVKINSLERKNLVSTCSSMIITHGGDKVVFGNKEYKVPKVEAFDVCGAGDTFLAALAVRYVETKDWDNAIHFAMEAAAVTVKHFGVYAPTYEEIYNEA